MPEPKQKPGLSGQVFRTPQNFLVPVRTYLGIGAFAHDFAANVHNRVCDSWWGEETNSPAQEPYQWATKVNGGWGWLNPPFKRMAPWVRRCWEMQQFDGQVALLVPAAVGSNWWRDYVHGKAHVLFLNGRIAFMEDRPTWGYPKDCALCLYSSASQWEPTYKVWSWKES